MAPFPDATNTGVPAGVTLTPYNGNLVINTPGAVISGLDIHGSVIINAANVTIQNCKITSASYCVVYAYDAIGATVKNCEINGLGTVSGSTGIGGQGTFLNNNIYNVENGFDLGGPALIQDNYIHNLKAAGSPHYDGIQIDGGVSNIVVSHNSIITNTTTDNSAVMIDNYFGPISNVTVDNNLLTGGAFTIFVDGRFNNSSITGVSITNNHFGPGEYGDISVNKANPTVSGNVYDGWSIAATLGHQGPAGATQPNAPSQYHRGPDRHFR
jgi:hypothetical protein